MRTFITALLATAALPGTATAQAGRPQAEEVVLNDAAARPAPRAERPAGAAQLAQRNAGERRGGGGGWERRGGGGGDVRTDGRGAGRWGGTPAANGPALQAQRGRDGNGWRGGFDRPATPPAAALAPQPRPERSGSDRRNGVDDARRWNGNRDGGRRDYNRRDDDRRDWNRRDDDRRDWDRRDDDRRDWNRNDRRFQGGWNDGRDGRGGWDRGWRNNSRYDWQRYRSSNRYAFRLPRYAAPYGWNYGYRRYAIGATLFSGLFAQNYWIGNAWDYRLPPAGWPYQWVRYYNDALLVDVRNGYVFDVIPDIFWY